MGPIDKTARKEGGSYSMRVVTRLTGLSPDTVRAWERRYQAIDPDRSEGGTRRFTERDVRRLVLLRELTLSGYRIGDVARLGDVELESLVAASVERAGRPVGAAEEEKTSDAVERLRERYLEAVARFDARAASDEMARAAMFLDGRQLVHEVVLPILRSVGDGWERGELSPAHEHLVTGQVRALIDTLLRLHSTPPGAARIVVSTPSGERHELGAIVGALLAATHGLGVVYLGPDLPARDIAMAARDSRARAVLLALAKPLTKHEQAELSRELEWLGKEVVLWVGMAPEHPLGAQLGRAKVFTSFEQLEAELTDLASRAPSAR